MTEGVIVALIISGFGLIGSMVTSMSNVRSLKHDINDIKISVKRLAEGLNIGLDNDKVIFNAFRKNCINGESEEQERKMDKYFKDSTIDSWVI